jgi:peroxiredoxin
MVVVSSTRQRSLIQSGSIAPRFRLARLDGTETALAELTSAGAVLLVFFKVTCPVCQLSMPFLERLYAAGTRVYGISQNNALDTREFNRYFGATFPTLLDDEDEGFPASNAYGISSVPTMFMVEMDGTVSRVIEGWNRKDMEGLGQLAGMNLFRPEDNVPAWKAG